MLTWLGNNAGTIVVCAALAAVIALIVVSRIKARKSGGSSCSCGCSACAMRDSCGKKRV